MDGLNWSEALSPVENSEMELLMKEWGQKN